ncbi:MAG: hypothetical protein DI551_04700 [Micavibrio aeruginosavorus]|uniref:Uncharacterized protein n=1 Tax=Micavibrio aeruginosavorus TaxID=349221 RepID=A0A2W5N0P8_9BACT|nr:MAG: hypothetical protein DI551_04700 [Micavibrio aeruginosavorus]
MSKDTPDLPNLPIGEATQSMQSSLDSFSNFLNAPLRKLDADEYMANDLDGVTESATGSGNLNFLMMQAGQTNEAIGNANPFNIAMNENPFDHFNPAFSNGFGITGNNNDPLDTNMDRGFGGDSGAGELGQLNGSNNTSSTAGNLSASNHASNSQSTNPFSDVTNYASSSSSNLSSSTITPANNGSNGSDGVSSNGQNGVDGTDGIDGTGGGDTIIENITNIIDDTTTNLGDVINNTTTNLGDVINNTVDNTSDILTTITNNVFDTINNIFNNGGGLGPIGLNLDVLVDDITNLNLDIINGDTITNVLNQTLDTAPLLNPVQDLLGNLLSHTSLDVLINPFQPDTGADDTDLHIGTDLELLGIHLPDLGIDVPLDIAEGLLGDIDINLDLTNELLGGLPLLGGGSGNGDTDLSLGGLEPILGADILNGIAETIVNPVENLVGDLDIGGALGLGLLGTDNNDGGPDTDISIPLGLGLMDNAVLGDTLNISLDPVENILGDIDLDLGIAANILGNIAEPFFDNLAGGNGQNDLLAQLGDGLSSAVGDILPFGDGVDTDLSLVTGIDLLGVDLVDNALNLALNPVEDLVGDLDIGGNIGLGLLGTNDTNGTDTDVVIPIDLGIIDNALLQDGLNISLDPIESVVGDIDLDLGIAGNILGNMAPDMFDAAMGGSDLDSPLSQVGGGLSDFMGDLVPFDQTGDTDVVIDTGLDLGVAGLDDAGQLVLDPVENILGDVDLNVTPDFDFLGLPDNSGTDSDLTINLGIGDMPLLGQDVHVPLDFAENIVGDIDLGVDLSSDIGDTIGALTDPLLSDALSPVDNALFDIVDAVNNTLSPVTDGLAFWADPIIADAVTNADNGLQSFDSVTNALTDGTNFNIDQLDSGLSSLLQTVDETLNSTIDGAVVLLDSSAGNTGGLDLGALASSVTGSDPISTLTTWTETILPSAGDILGTGLTADPSSMIPDPIITMPTTSLPTIPVITTAPIVSGLLGGSGNGGSHHGGLFG